MQSGTPAFQVMPTYIGPYRVLNEVGAGGLGKVYRAVDERTGQVLAVKVLHTQYTTNRRFLGIFHRELLILAGLSHKHIVNYVGSFFDPPVCYIATEFVDGWSGYQLLKRTGRMPPLVALSIVIDMLQGIDHLHLHEVVHSDLSAANFLVDKTGRVLVTDFGLACKFEVEDYKNFMVGTPGYYSPEHISQSAIVPQTDIYCAGLILFELMTGIKAIPATQDRKNTLKAMKRLAIPEFNFTDKKLAKGMRKLISKALEYSPSSRFNSAEAMMLACYAILREHNIRYARYAIKQFLQDKGLVEPTSGFDLQDIYKGL